MYDYGEVRTSRDIVPGRVYDTIYGFQMMRDAYVALRRLHAGPVLNRYAEGSVAQTHSASQLYYCPVTFQTYLGPMVGRLVWMQLLPVKLVALIGVGPGSVARSHISDPPLSVEVDIRALALARACAP